MTVTLKISNASAAAVRRGHPWVYAESGLTGQVGQVVELRDNSGAYLGWGLYDRGAIAVRVLGRGKPDELGRLLIERIARADRFRSRTLSVDTDAYRVLSGAGGRSPGVGG